MRWRIALLLCGVALVNYFERVNVSVAADPIMKAFHLTQTQMGRVFSAFVVGYAVFQIPGGMLADRFGPRRVLAWSIAFWGVFTFVTGAAGRVALLTGAGVLGALIVTRLLLGICEGPTFPAITRAVVSWFPPSERARANGVAITGISLGSFLTPPVVTWMISKLGWESCFFVSAAVSIVVAAAWALYARDIPTYRSAAAAPEPLTIPNRKPIPAAATARWSSPGPTLRNGNLWRLIASYTLHGYVAYVFIFWFYLYLLQVRKFGQAESAWLASVAWLFAAVMTIFAGYLSDRLILTRLGMDWGRRIVPMTCQAGAAVSLMVGARLENAYVAAGLLAFCTGLVMGVEGPYWASANQMSRGNVGLAGGLLNAGGNLGGLLSPALTPVIAAHFGWVHALDIAAVIALVAATSWLWVRPSKPSGVRLLSSANISRTCS